MNRVHLLIALISTMPNYAMADISFSWHGASPAQAKIINIPAPKSSGIDCGIKVAYGTDGLRMRYDATSSPADVKWYRFSGMGAAYADEIASSGKDSTASWIDNPQGDTGYIIEDGDKRLYIWLTDYSRHPLSLGELSAQADHDCGNMNLKCTGKGDEIHYYSITGRRMTLSRDMSLTYTSLIWDDTQKSFAESPVTSSLDHLSPTLHVEAPLCATSFTLTGDRFLREWGCEQTYISPIFQPHSILAHTQAIQATRYNDNEISGPQNGTTLGGSAPCTVKFIADVTDAAVFHEWQFSRHRDFEDIIFRASGTELTHTFTEHGSIYVRLYCANDDASCEYFGETYEIFTGTSSLKCPNAFSPLNMDGVNDVWKVSYSSIIDFECHIFNRHGTKIVSLTDPSQGWDGKHGGKYVPAGAYFYTIRALGADGKRYELSGDINIVEYR